MVENTLSLSIASSSSSYNSNFSSIQSELSSTSMPSTSSSTLSDTFTDPTSTHIPQPTTTPHFSNVLNSPTSPTRYFDYLCNSIHGVHGNSNLFLRFSFAERVLSSRQRRSESLCLRILWYLCLSPNPIHSKSLYLTDELAQLIYNIPVEAAAAVPPPPPPPLSSPFSSLYSSSKFDAFHSTKRHRCEEMNDDNSRSPAAVSVILTANCITYHLRLGGLSSKGREEFWFYFQTIVRMLNTNVEAKCGKVECFGNDVNPRRQKCGMKLQNCDEGEEIYNNDIFDKNVSNKKQRIHQYCGSYQNGSCSSSSNSNNSSSSNSYRSCSNSYRSCSNSYSNNSSTCSNSYSSNNSSSCSNCISSNNNSISSCSNSYSTNNNSINNTYRSNNSSSCSNSYSSNNSCNNSISCSNSYSNNSSTCSNSYGSNNNSISSSCSNSYSSNSSSCSNSDCHGGKESWNDDVQEKYQQFVKKSTTQKLCPPFSYSSVSEQILTNTSHVREVSASSSSSFPHLTTESRTDCYLNSRAFFPSSLLARRFLPSSSATTPCSSSSCSDASDKHPNICIREDHGSHPYMMKDEGVVEASNSNPSISQPRRFHLQNGVPRRTKLEKCLNDDEGKDCPFEIIVNLEPIKKKIMKDELSLSLHSSTISSSPLEKTSNILFSLPAPKADLPTTIPSSSPFSSSNPSLSSSSSFAASFEASSPPPPAPPPPPPTSTVSNSLENARNQYLFHLDNLVAHAKRLPSASHWHLAANSLSRITGTLFITSGRLGKPHWKSKFYEEERLFEISACGGFYSAMRDAVRWRFEKEAAVMTSSRMMRKGRSASRDARNALPFLKDEFRKACLPISQQHMENNITNSNRNGQPPHCQTEIQRQKRICGSGGGTTEAVQDICRSYTSSSNNSSSRSSSRNSSSNDSSSTSTSSNDSSDSSSDSSKSDNDKRRYEDDGKMNLGRNEIL